MECKVTSISQGIVELRQLIDQAPDFSSLIQDNRNGFQVLEMEDGSPAFIYDAWHKNGEISVTVNFSPADVIFPRHQHPGWECFVIWSGEMRLTLDNEPERILRPPVSYYVPTGIGHSAYFPVKTWYLAITIPPDPTWPGVKKNVREK